MEIKTIMNTPMINYKDDDVDRICDESKALLTLITGKYELMQQVYVGQTIHGHYATIARQEGRFVPGTEPHAAALDSDDFVFLSSLKGVRWIECRCGEIIIGFDEFATTGNLAALNSIVEPTNLIRRDHE